MNEPILSREQLNTVLNENLNEHFWTFQLAVGAKESFNTSDNDFSFNFYEKGKELWAKYLPLLKSIICDKERKIIKPVFDEVVLGNVRELVMLVYTLLTGDHNLTAAIAIPLVALIVKYNLQEFCSN